MGESLLGTKVGHFRVVDLVATGGMGDVYVGYDELLERRVALKSIRAEHTQNEEAKARFLREARVLSQLGHPNICQIFDYLTGESADFLVLEFIEGRNLRQLMKKGIEDRLMWRIAEQVAGVLVAAHEKGIIHRDLKPDNIMVSEGEQVKVLDFGLSGLVGEQAGMDFRRLSAMNTVGVAGESGTVAPLAAEKPLGATPSQAASSGHLTTAGTILGTLGYMSPEQARGEAASAASDMYAFGLMLQELFTGKPAYDPALAKTALLERTLQGETLPVEGVDPDLAALIARLKSLLPSARPSAVDSAEKLAWIRGKRARLRRRVLAWAAALALVVFSAAMTIQSVRATRAERKAQREAEAAQHVTDFLEEMFKLYEPGESKGNAVTAKELLDAGSGKVRQDLKNEPTLQARLMVTMGSLYSDLGLFAEAEPLLEESLQSQTRLHGAESPEVALSLKRLGQLRSDQGNYAEAEALLNRSLAIYQKVEGPNSKMVLSIINDLAWVASGQQKTAEAEARFREGLKLAERILEPNDPHLGGMLLNLGQFLADEGKLAEAEPLERRALAMYEKSPGPDSLYYGTTLTAMAFLSVKQGRFEEAETLFRRALAILEAKSGPEDSSLMPILFGLGSMYTKQGRDSEAVSYFKRDAAIAEKLQGAGARGMAMIAHWYLAGLFARGGSRADAFMELRRAVALGWDHPEAITTSKDLQALHGDPEFDRLVGEAKRQSEAKEKAKKPAPPSS